MQLSLLPETSSLLNEKTQNYGTDFCETKVLQGVAVHISTAPRSRFFASRKDARNYAFLLFDTNYRHNPFYAIKLIKNIESALHIIFTGFMKDKDDVSVVIG